MFIKTLNYKLSIKTLCLQLNYRQKDIVINNQQSMSTSAHNSSGLTPADYLRQLSTTHVNTTQVSLDFRAITDLLPILHLIGSFKRLKKLSLHGNRIKQLPADLSKLSGLQWLDISNNLLDNNVQLTLISLKTLPNLKHLIYPVPPQKQQLVVEELKSLQYFNNIRVQRRAARKQVVFNQLNRRNMNEFQSRLGQFYLRLNQLQQKYLDEKNDGNTDGIQRFQQDIAGVSQEYLQRLARSTDKGEAPPQSLQNVMLYMAKYEMFDQLTSKALHLCQDIYSDIGDFMLMLYHQQGDLFKSLSEQALNLTRLEYDVRQQAQVQKKMTQQNGEYAILNKNLTMQKEIKRLKKQRDQLISELNQSETQNKKLIDALMKFAKGDKGVLVGYNNGPVMKDSKVRGQNEMYPSHVGGLTNRNIPLPVLKSNDKALNIKANTTIKDSFNLQSNYSTGGSGGNRNLTLKQLKQTIQQIYQSKLKFDQKNYDGKIARQTMHQYLFTYINQKYGLKNLTIEAAASIVAGIQAYSSEDNDICVFGKILRNEVDEEFRFVQTELKTTVTDLLKMHIKTKMPYKSATQINQTLNDKMSNDIIWEQAQDIVKYLYNKEDSQAIIKKLDILFKINQKPAGVNRRMTRQQQAALMSQKHVRKLKFSQFLKCVLDFQLKNHQKLLKPLVGIFKSKDGDSDGIINQQEFIEIIMQLCQEGNDIVPYLLNIVDPYEIKQITFTQMVRLVANYPQSSPILSRFIGQEEEEQGFNNNQREDDNQYQ